MGSPADEPLMVQYQPPPEWRRPCIAISAVSAAGRTQQENVNPLVSSVIMSADVRRLSATPSKIRP